MEQVSILAARVTVQGRAMQWSVQVLEPDCLGLNLSSAGTKHTILAASFIFLIMINVFFHVSKPYFDIVTKKTMS